MKPALASSLKSDTALYGAAVLAERVLGLLLLPLLTRRLSAEDYGIWAQTQVISGMALPLLMFCLPTAIVRFLSGGGQAAERRRWMARSALAVLVVLALVALLAWPWRAAVARWLYGGEARAMYLPVLVVLMAADALLELLIAFLRSAFRMRPIALLTFGRGALRFGFMLMALTVLRMDFARAFAVLVLAQAGVVAVIYAVEFRRLAGVTVMAGHGLLPRPSGERAGVRGRAAAEPGFAGPHPHPLPEGEGVRSADWPTILRFCAPLVLVAVLTSINTFADRFVLTHLMGLNAVAVYAAVASLISITNVAYTVLGFTLFPVLSRLWLEGDQPRVSALAADAVRVFLFLALPFTAWLACIAGNLLPLLTTNAYRVPAGVVLLMGLAAVGFGLYQILLYLLLLAGRGLHAAVAMGTVAALNVLLNLLLVPEWGLLGAAAAAALSNALLAVLAYANARAHAHARFPWANTARIVLGAALGAGALLLAQSRLDAGTWLSVIASLAAAAVVYLAADLLLGRSVIRAFVWRGATA